MLCTCAHVYNDAYLHLYMYKQGRICAVHKSTWGCCGVCGVANVGLWSGEFYFQELTARGHKLQDGSRMYSAGFAIIPGSTPAADQLFSVRLQGQHSGKSPMQAPSIEVTHQTIVYPSIAEQVISTTADGKSASSSLGGMSDTSRRDSVAASHSSRAASSFVVDELEEISMEPEPGAGMTQDLRMSQPSMPTGAKESSSASEDEATLSVVGSALQKTSDGIPGQAPASSLAQQLPTTREKYETAMVSHNSSAASSFVVDELEEISMEPEPVAGITQDLRMSQPSMPTGAKESSSASEDEATLCCWQRITEDERRHSWPGASLVIGAAATND